MTRTLLTVGFLGATLLISSQALAQSKGEGNAARGRIMVYTCAGCHGQTGYENAYPRYHVPRIAGQNYQYIVDALNEYKKGTRTHPTMNAQADSFTQQDFIDIATYLSSIKVEGSRHSVEGNAARGKTKAKTCFACHGADGQSIAPQYPDLAGQYADYIVQVLKEYKSGQRENPIMKGFATPLSEQDMEDIAAYFSSLPRVLDDLHNHIQGSD